MVERTASLTGAKTVALSIARTAVRMTAQTIARKSTTVTARISARSTARKTARNRVLRIAPPTDRRETSAVGATSALATAQIIAEVEARAAPPSVRRAAPQTLPTYARLESTKSAAPTNATLRDKGHGTSKIATPRRRSPTTCAARYPRPPISKARRRLGSRKTPAGERLGGAAPCPTRKASTSL